MNLFRGIMVLLIIVLLFGCSSSTESGSKYNPPADHTVSKEGVKHKSGLNDPLANCVGCHGADLKGGTVGVSCYECHGAKWN